MLSTKSVMILRAQPHILDRNALPYLRARLPLSRVRSNAAVAAFAFSRSRSDKYPDW